jgi:hypothetical protein
MASINPSSLLFKDADGKLTWDVELGADGTVVINGVIMPKTK